MIHVLITDDDPFIRESLELIIGLDPEITVVGTCTNGDEASPIIQNGVQVDVVLMDIRMPICDGVEGTTEYQTTNPERSLMTNSKSTLTMMHILFRRLRNSAQRLFIEKHFSRSHYSRRKDGEARQFA